MCEQQQWLRAARQRPGEHGRSGASPRPDTGGHGLLAQQRHPAAARQPHRRSSSCMSGWRACWRRPTPRCWQRRRRWGEAWWQRSPSPRALPSSLVRALCCVLAQAGANPLQRLCLAVTHTHWRRSPHSVAAAAVCRRPVLSCLAVDWCNLLCVTDAPAAGNAFGRRVLEDWQLLHGRLPPLLVRYLLGGECRRGWAPCRRPARLPPVCSRRLCCHDRCVPCLLHQGRHLS